MMETKQSEDSAKESIGRGSLILSANTGEILGETKSSRLSRLKAFRFPSPSISDYGMKPETNTFYEDPDSLRRPNWVPHTLPTLPETKRQKFKRYAILEFQDPSDEDLYGNVPVYKISHIKIQSPVLLKEIRAKEAQPFFSPQDVNFSLDIAEIRAPLKPLFFGRDWLLKRLDEVTESGDLLAKSHLAVFHSIIERQLGEVIQKAERLKETNEITFDLLWTLFPKGTLVKNWQYSTHCGYRVCCTHLDSCESYSCFKVHCHYVSFDGNGFGYNEMTFHIDKFSDSRKILSLPVYPYIYDENPSACYKSFVERGKAILDMQGIRHLQCHGHGFDLSHRPFGGTWDINSSLGVSPSVAKSERSLLTTCSD
jgi:hypothetical protein